MPLDEEGLRLLKQVAIHTMHARNDSEALAMAARAGLFAKYERLVDPEDKLTPKERTRRAKHAVKADMARLAFERHQAKRKIELAAGGVL